MSKKDTFVFKTINGLDLLADVYLPSTPPSSDAGYPIVFHMHGGGLVVGDRATLSPVFINNLMDHNWALVAFDYRLAPEVKIDDIWSDCEDAYQWVLKDAARLAKTTLDTSKIALYGVSSGGYLVLVGGYKFTPRPKAILNFYGSSDILDSFYSTPKENLDPEKVAPDSVLNAISDRPLSGFNVFTDPTAQRISLFTYFIQKGTYIEQIMGLDVHKQTDVEKLLSWAPLRNITADFPPTFTVHGDSDTVISLSESVRLVQELEKHGVTHQLVVAKGFDHTFDFMLKPGDKAWDSNVEPAFAFLEKYLQ